ncbi:MAG: YidH family protein, partial [Isosphaeraceae bacterium]
MTEKVRDHLANERTFLAWVRTALGLIGFGFVLARMGLFLQEMTGRAVALEREDPPGTGREFLVAGVVFLVVGTVLSAWSGW